MNLRSKRVSRERRKVHLRSKRISSERRNVNLRSKCVSRKRSIVNLRSKCVSRERSIVNLRSERVSRERRNVNLRSKRVSCERSIVNLKSKRVSRERRNVNLRSKRISRERRNVNLRSKRVSYKRSIVNLRSNSVSRERSIVNLRSKSVSRKRRSSERIQTRLTREDKNKGESEELDEFNVEQVPNGTKVAVKLLNGFGQVKKSFLAEVETIGSIHHVNLVRLIGFCVEKSYRLLVYEYMFNRSLDTWIFQRHQELTLGWQSRRKIIMDIAKGLTYLYEECRQKIFHLDIKPQNILLDEYFNAKISDF
ncbi:hypothetical protein ACSBR2_034944 [Camellia fascicularis]